MSDRELGKKMIEEEELLQFLEVYKENVEEYLSYGFGRSERPDFICYRPDGTPVGVELVKVMRNPMSAQAEYILDRIDFMDSDSAVEMLYQMIEKKEEKRRQPDWTLPDNAILVIQFVDCPVTNLYQLDERLKDDFRSYGFGEIWIADYTGLKVYGDVELFCLYPSEWWGFYERENPGRKPYG